MARPKRVIRVKLFRRWFIFCDYSKFRLILSKSPCGAQVVFCLSGVYEFTIKITPSDQK
jgi:hypothetical protein